MVISEDPWHQAIAERLAVEPVFITGLSRLGFEHPTFQLRGQRSNPLRRGDQLYRYIETIGPSMVDKYTRYIIWTVTQMN